jgi:hypothetical protein
MNPWSLLADLVLLIHLGFVLFIVGGLVVIVIGHLAGWRWVRNFKFRVAHLAAMGFVLIETLVGVICPLTEWENALRIRAGEDAPYARSFVGTWVGRLLFYDLPESVFAAVYAACFLSVLACWWWARPIRRPAPDPGNR